MGRKKIVLEGFSTYGIHLARILSTQHDLYVLDPDKERCTKLTSETEGGLDGRVISEQLNDNILEEIGPFDVFIAAYDINGLENLRSCLLIKERYSEKAPKMISLVGDGETERILEKEGVTTINPYKLTLEKIKEAMEQ